MDIFKFSYHRKEGKGNFSFRAMTITNVVLYPWRDSGSVSFDSAKTTTL